MKRLFRIGVVTVVGLWFIFTVGYFASTLIHFPTPEEAKARRQAELAELHERRANWLIAERRYLKDPRTTPPSCYLYLTSGPNPGLTMTLAGPVDCSSIPPDLLDVPTEPEP